MEPFPTEILPTEVTFHCNSYYKQIPRIVVFEEGRKLKIKDDVYCKNKVRTTAASAYLDGLNKAPFQCLGTNAS